jgi:hypothetical protein
VFHSIKDKALIGVYIRGTDYLGAKGHHIQPELKDIWEVIDLFLSSYNVDGIYLATEEEQILNYAISIYGKKLFYQEKSRVNDFIKGKTLTPELSISNSDKITQGREYLADIEILSRLDYFISGINNGSAAVIERNGLKFKDYSIFYYGINS